MAMPGAVLPDMDEKPKDWESTTSVLARRAPGLAWLPNILRERFTVTGLVTAVTALVATVAYILNAQHEIHEAKEGLRMQQNSITDLEKDRDVLRKIDTQLEVMGAKVDGIADEVDQQRQWRNRIEGIAESPPHARKRK
jgi:hypothetical protein